MDKYPQVYHLVIGFTGPIGSGSSESAKLIGDIFTEKYSKYCNTFINEIKVSKSLEYIAKDVLSDWDKLSLDKKRNTLQEIGNALRSMNRYRIGKNIVLESILYRQELEFNASKPNLILTIIDSLKNPSDHEFLKLTYGHCCPK